MSTILLSTAYLAPIQYYSKLVNYDQVIIEKFENFIKQTYRNRCEIYGANGVLTLSIPIKKDKPKELVKDIQIDYSTNWVKMHWKSIESAYRSSPFFEFYADDLIPFYEKEYKFLFDLNAEIQNVIIDLLDLDVEIKFTNEYVFTDDLQNSIDFREKIHPKKKIIDSDFIEQNYNQVFMDKDGFKSNLSIIDLLFNEGPNAINLIH